MKSIAMIMVFMSSFNIQNTDIEYNSSFKEQVICYQVTLEDSVKDTVNDFMYLLRKYILDNNIEIMTEDNYINFISIYGN